MKPREVTPQYDNTGNLNREYRCGGYFTIRDTESQTHTIIHATISLIFTKCLSRMPTICKSNVFVYLTSRLNKANSF